ncbi:pyridoxal-phosphate dependent enzyme [Bradyrhizobium sp. 179]|uniref:pyridoxal-phosphate dependent enzyme n=1 Tax=Bradyrhizobium sp. 179 TaxID=2782648 RepID=UPI001FF77DC6|nr:pyridoxal-phosphate dependent enzyme [Bradyrhizobium sp. 179]
MQKILSEDFSFQLTRKPAPRESYDQNGPRRYTQFDCAGSGEKEITSWPGYRPTPLRCLDGLARAAGVRAVLYKDEGSRFNLGSFKALGGAYAVASILQREIEVITGKRPSTEQLAAGSLKALTADITVTCATDGNHGRSVAWGARTFGCRCVIDTSCRDTA